MKKIMSVLSISTDSCSLYTGQSEHTVVQGHVLNAWLISDKNKADTRANKCVTLRACSLSSSLGTEIRTLHCFGINAGMKLAFQNDIQVFLCRV